MSGGGEYFGPIGGATGAVGPAGPTGATGATGSTGGGAELAYVAFTAPVSVTTAFTAPTTIVSSGAEGYNGTPIIVEFFAPYALPGTLDALIFSLYDGATFLGYFGQAGAAGATSSHYPISLKNRLTPTAASHTYLVACGFASSATNGSIGAGTGGAGNYLNGFIRVTSV